MEKVYTNSVDLKNCRIWSNSTITGYHNATTSVPYPVRDDYSFTQTDITYSNLGTAVFFDKKHGMCELHKNK